MSEYGKRLDLATFRDRVAGSGGRAYWRSLEELVQDPAFEEVLREEFPQEAHALRSGVDRREFVKLFGASLAFGGLTACSRPLHTIVPYVRQPEETVPGKPLFYATAMTIGGIATGLLAESHLGRPTKIEGNPEHPASLGATDAFAQAAILSLYDPDRSQTVRHLGDISTWTDFLTAFQPLLTQLERAGGAGLALLTETITSPTIGDQLQQILRRFPALRWVQYEPARRDNVREGARIAFGRAVNPVYHFAAADVVVSLDADFLSCEPGHLRYVREFTDRRRVRSGTTEMNRLYVIEPSLTNTGTLADHRFPTRAVDVEQVARAIAAAIGAGSAAAAATPNWIAALARDLTAHRGRSLVLAGEAQPPAVHAIVHAINMSLGNIGSTVLYTEPLEVLSTNGNQELRQLTAAMHRGEVQCLVALGTNPAFTAPADLRFQSALDRVPFRVHTGMYYDETAALSHWHIPQTHFLEEWGDARAFDGTVTLTQPLIAPLYNGRSAGELLGVLSGNEASPYDQIRAYWRGKAPADFESFWNRSLHDGLIANTALPQMALVPSTAFPPPAAQPHGGLELVFRPDPTIYDGRFANNGWLQELPNPVTKLTWDNAALMSPATAARLGVASEQVISIENRGARLEVAVLVVPGHADDSITLHYGHGRARAGQVGNGTGVNAYALRSSEAPDFETGITVRRTSRVYRLALTQLHHTLDDRGLKRDLVRSGTVQQFLANPNFASHPPHDALEGPSLYPKDRYDGYKWGMVIDTTVCNGCSGCVVACQAENNISIVGKKEVLNNREMHWLRIDHYYKGDPANPESVNMPVPCMHCEKAPCEPVCPVEATSHSSEGINEMTYNRCIGTRYCENNCPYKVRRFNFFQYADYETPSLKGMRNPDVTVRSRGVMEKCTYCVQRVNSARIEAEKEGRRVRDGEVQTACQAACPAKAITFGDLNDPGSEVARLKTEPLNYALLPELNTQPRTTYLGALRNPNPEITPPTATAFAHGTPEAEAQHGAHE